MNNLGNQPTHSSLIHRRRGPTTPRLKGNGTQYRRMQCGTKRGPITNSFIDRRPFHSSVAKKNPGWRGCGENGHRPEGVGLQAERGECARCFGSRLETLPGQRYSSLSDRCDIQGPGRAVALAKETRLAVPQIGNVGSLRCPIHPENVHRTMLNTFPAPDAQLAVNSSYPHATPLLRATSNTG